MGGEAKRVFTGIVEAVGRIRSVDYRNDITRFTIAGPVWVRDLEIGASVAVNGACLTVVDKDAESFQVEAVPETLRRTNLGSLQPGHEVNLERAVRLGEQLDGHLVTGHIDGMGTVVSIQKDSRDQSGTTGESYRLTVEAPEEIMQYVVPKGSIAVDGVSLTVAQCDHRRFSVVIIPHTWRVTTLGYRRPGDPVNLEADIIGKYVRRFVEPYISPSSGGSGIGQ